ncbi:MAG TPA: hypothetical protein VFR25_04015 [Candidatus Eisenbacteria bacterium]|nr:hypothetical protein [Candidatus Eisenbacteria bacterium]
MPDIQALLPDPGACTVNARFHPVVAATILALAMAATPVPANTQSPPPASKPPKVAVVRGELLDLSCWLARGLSGPLHQDCAKRCIASGVPMGIITADSTLWLLTQEHGRSMAPGSYAGSPDPFVQCKDWPSYTVEVKGLASTRNGVHVVEVARATLISKPAATTP